MKLLKKKQGHLNHSNYTTEIMRNLFSRLRLEVVGVLAKAIIPILGSQTNHCVFLPQPSSSSTSSSSARWSAAGYNEYIRGAWTNIFRQVGVLRASSARHTWSVHIYRGIASHRAVQSIFLRHTQTHMYLHEHTLTPNRWQHINIIA